MHWLEIENDRVIGVHTEKCQSPHHWVEYQGNAMPGDHFQDGKVIPRQQKKDPVENKRRLCRLHILSFYPMEQQLNILRGGDTTTIATMGTFIDACRDWSNDPKSPVEGIHDITPHTR